MKHLLIGDIQDVIIDHFQKYQHGISFTEAVAILISEGKLKYHPPVIPDFLSWDPTRLRDLKSLVSEIPIYIDESRPLTFTEEPSVLINLEFFNPDNYKMTTNTSVIYVISGSATFHTQTQACKLEPGDVIIVSPGLPHQIICSPDDITVNITSQPDLFEQHLTQILKKNELLFTFFQQSLHGKKKSFLRFELPPSHEALNIIKHLFFEAASNQTFSTEIFLSYLQIFYSLILRNCKTDSLISIARSIQNSNNAFHTSFHTNNYRSVTLSILAQQFNYSEAYLSRLIKKTTGENFNQIVKRMKIDEAKQCSLYAA
jgi:AraC-like DNA-binding protein